MRKTGFKKITAVVLALLLTVSISSAFTAALAEGAPPDGGGGASGGGANTMTYDYSGTMSAAKTANGEAVTSDGETISASDADVNAALAENGGALTITGGTLTKSGDDTNGDNCNFYGINSILLAAGSGSASYISDSSLSAGSEGSNGIFSTDGATVFANNDTIATTAGNSRGLDATYGGTIIANLLDISTQGDHCASLATDRGGGYVSVTNSTLATAGSGSPLIYSTGDIEVDNVTGTASDSQIAGMEGLNTILIYNSELTSTCSTTTGSDPVANGIIIYQSTSGDAESTTGSAAVFNAVDSTLTSAVTGGTMFYLTNTSANIVLKNTVLDFDSTSSNLLTVQGNDSNSWGTAGSNGAAVTFTGIGETLSGNIDVDTISSLDMYLLESSTYTGSTAISENSVNTGATEAPITMNLDSTSTWVVTGDSTVTNLNAESGAKIVDANGNTVSIVAGGETVVSGTSQYTITVTGAYSATVTTGSANELTTSYIDRTSFDEYYSTSTSFSTNGQSESAAETASPSPSSTEAASSPSPTAAAAAAVTADQGVGSTVWYLVIVAAVVIGVAAFIIYKVKSGKKR